jgi:Choline-glycine betaine transporter
MNNLSKPRFITSILLLSLITAIVSLNSDISQSFFLDLQAFLSKYLGWMIILIANGFVIFAFFPNFYKYKILGFGGIDANLLTIHNWIAMLFSAG